MIHKCIICGERLVVGSEGLVSCSMEERRWHLNRERRVGGAMVRGIGELSFYFGDDSEGRDSICVIDRASFED